MKAGDRVRLLDNEYRYMPDAGGYFGPGATGTVTKVFNLVAVVKMDNPPPDGNDFPFYFNELETI